MRRRIIIAPLLEKFKEPLGAALLEKTHERRSDSLHFSTWHFGNAPVTVHIASADLLELEISGHIRVDEHIHNLAVSHHELWNHVYSIVTVSSDICWHRLARTELVVQLRQVQRGTFGTIVVISVDMEYLFAFNRQ